MSYHLIKDLLNTLEREVVLSTKASRAHRDQLALASSSLDELIQQRTEAFIQLAQHYLPELSHQSVSKSWQEVREQLLGILQVKQYERGESQRKIKAANERLEDFHEQRERLQKRIDEERVVLNDKFESVRKELQEDPEVKSHNREIVRIDREVESCLSQLEQSKENSAEKLPDYEQSSLFSYLNDEKFGTPEYQGTGLKRRWDRWLAKLIGYKNAKQSFDFLLQTPKHLKELIDSKQQRYRSLLEILAEKRIEAVKRHGLSEQKQIWQDACNELSVINDQIEDEQWKVAAYEDEICELDNVRGEHYESALKIYQNFLQTTEPETLRVYAECTESPVDDQICAQLRQVGKEIESKQQSNAALFTEIASAEKWIALVRDLDRRLRRFAIQTPGRFHSTRDFDFQDFLAQVRSQEQSPTDAWRKLRQEFLAHKSVNEKPSFLEHLGQQISQMNPLDATFAAASDFVWKAPSGNAIDISDVVWIPDNENLAAHHFDGLWYRALWSCQSRPEARYVLRFLRAAEIRCFVHTYSDDPVRSNSAQKFEVVVAYPDIEKAKNIVSVAQQNREKAWRCKCGKFVNTGFSSCWYCGRRKTNARR